MYNVVITVPFVEDSEGTLVPNPIYPTCVGIALGLPSTKPHGFNTTETSNKIMIMQDTDDTVAVVAAFAAYTEVTISVSEVVAETP